MTAQPRISNLTSDIQYVPTRRSETNTGGGKVGRMVRKSITCVPGFKSTVPANHKSIRAVISSEDSKTAAKVMETSKGSDGSLSALGREVKAVITIRKKMKEKLVDKVEDQWESFINGIGRGIFIQLISEDIDPG